MTAEKSSQETSEGGSQSLDESKMIDMINEVSDTMLIVFVRALRIFIYLVAAAWNDGPEYGSRGKGRGRDLASDRRKIQEYYGCC